MAGGSREKYLKRANAVIQLLNEEKIDSSGDKNFNTSLDQARTATMNCAVKSGVRGPALTSCVATTLLKKGKCQELAQRFVLEYCIKYKEQNVSLIFLSNPSVGRAKDDHTLVFVGPINVPDSLITGKGNSDLSIKPEVNNLSLVDFLKSNQEGVFADPLLKCAGMGMSDEGAKPLFDYCKKYNLTHIIAVRSYASTPGLVESASSIKENAYEIARQVEKEMKPKPYESLTTKTIHAHLKEVKKFNCRAGASGYIKRLEEILGKECVIKDPVNPDSVSFPVFWLRQLGKEAIQELSSELGVPQQSLRP